MKHLILHLFNCFVVASFAQPNWQSIKDSTFVTIDFPLEYGLPYKQALSVGGWEDGIYISRDGKNLYCLYSPVDLFSWQFYGGADLANFSPYSRGPQFGMDLTTNPVGASEWLHSDILISQRNNLSEPFNSWSLSNLATPVWSEGAVQINSISGSTAEYFVFASNNVSPSYKTDLFYFTSSNLNPTGGATPFPFPLNDSLTREDNPHLERLSATDLVIFFDSDDRIGGEGQLDIWFSTSNDNGVSWSVPSAVSTINTNQSEQQPHLFNDGTFWYLYYTATNSITGKSEIYRAKQTTATNWNSWDMIERVIGAGNAFAVGEPTLTAFGDISFVVLYEDSVNGTSTDKYDADPWFLPKNGSPLSLIEKKQNQDQIIVKNPIENTLEFRTDSFVKTGDDCLILDHLGKILLRCEVDENLTIELNHLVSGSYFLNHVETGRTIQFMLKR